MRGIWKQFEKPLTLVATLIYITTVAGCVTTMASNENRPVCAAWSSITWSDQDTDQTIKEVKGNNAARNSYCGK